jgi:hypothetical protein
MERIRIPDKHPGYATLPIIWEYGTVPGTHLIRVMVDAAMTNPEGSAAQLLPLLYEVPGHLPVVHIVNISLKYHFKKFKNENLEKFIWSK